MRVLSKEQFLKISAFFCELEIEKARKIGILSPKREDFYILAAGNYYRENFSFNINYYSPRKVRNDLEAFLIDAENLREESLVVALHNHCKKKSSLYVKALKSYDPSIFLDRVKHSCLLERIVKSPPSSTVLLEHYLIAKSSLLMRQGEISIHFECDIEDEEVEFDFDNEQKCMEQYLQACKAQFKEMKKYLVDPAEALEIYAHLPVSKDEDDDYYDYTSASIRRFAAAVDPTYLPFLLLDQSENNRQFAVMLSKYLNGEKSEIAV
jgi:hypothetical protein